MGFLLLHVKNFIKDFPIEEEARLLDPWLRENFVMQIFAYDEAMRMEQKVKVSELVAFHTAYKFLLHSKSEKTTEH